jgi:membrane protease YdiL (CAAX protease family)
MTRARNIEIRWHAVCEACLRLGLAFGAGFLVLALLNRIPEFESLAQNSPWIPKYIGDSIAFAVGMVIVRRVSQGRPGEYGFALAGRNLKLKPSIALGVIMGLTGVLLDHLPEVVAGDPIQPAHAYPLTLLNVLGMMSFQWIFVGIFEETITRGLVQTQLMNELKGSVRILKWDFHTGTVITAVIFGVGHFGPHVFFGGSWLSLAPHLVFAALYGLCSGYIYQETRSLAGPVLMHNVVDGLIYSIDYLFH